MTIREAVEKIREASPDGFRVRSLNDRYAIGHAPHRDDFHPSFAVFVGRDGTILVHDYAQPIVDGKNTLPIHVYVEKVLKGKKILTSAFQGTNIDWEKEHAKAEPILAEGPAWDPTRTLVSRVKTNEKGITHASSVVPVIRRKDGSLVFLLRSIYNPTGPVITRVIRTPNGSFYRQGASGPVFLIPNHEPEKIKRIVLVEGLRNAALVHRLVHKLWKGDSTLVIGLPGAKSHIRHLRAILRLYPNLKEVRLLIDNDTHDDVPKILQRILAPLVLTTHRFSGEHVKRKARWLNPAWLDSYDPIDYLEAAIKRTEKRRIRIGKNDSVDWLSWYASYYLRPLVSMNNATIYSRELARGLFLTPPSTRGYFPRHLEALIALLRIHETLKPVDHRGRKVVIKTSWLPVLLNSQVSLPTAIKYVGTLEEEGVLQKLGRRAYLVDLDEMVKRYYDIHLRDSDALTSLNTKEMEPLRYDHHTISLLRKHGWSYRDISRLYGFTHKTISGVRNHGDITWSPVGFTTYERGRRLVEESLMSWEDLTLRAIAFPYLANIINDYEEFRREMKWTSRLINWFRSSPDPPIDFRV